MDKSTSQQVSHRHHYVPQFYLRTWQDTERRSVWLYARKAGNKIMHSRRSAKSVGYVNDLYSLRPDSPWPVLNPATDVLEKNFFALVDARAASVHQKLISTGLGALSSTDKFNWALFLNSLMERNPKRIGEIEQSLALSSEEIVKKFTIRWEHSEFLEKIDASALLHNSVRNAIVAFIDDEAFISHVANNMNWVTIDVPINGEHLLTSDMPLLINGGMEGNPIHVLSIALSPRRLLIIHSRFDEFDDDFIRTLAVMHNIAIVENTQQHLISSQELKDGPYTKFSRIIEAKLKVFK